MGTDEEKKDEGMAAESSAAPSIHDDGCQPDKAKTEVCCRICHEASSSGLMRACRCDGSMRFVHESCLLPWIVDYNHKKCEICKQSYGLKKTLLPMRSWRWPEIPDVSCCYFLFSLFCKLLFVASNWYGFYINFNLMNNWNGEYVCLTRTHRHILGWVAFHKALTMIIFLILYLEWNFIRRDLLSELAAWFLIGTCLGATALKQIFMAAHLTMENFGSPWYNFGTCLSSVIQAEALLNWPVFLIIVVDTSIAPWLRSFQKHMTVTRIMPFNIITEHKSTEPFVQKHS